MCGLEITFMWRRPSRESFVKEKQVIEVFGEILLFYRETLYETSILKQSRVNGIMHGDGS